MMYVSGLIVYVLGTGKTTVAQRFGVMFRNLELLPRSDVEVVTAANLISRYMYYCI